jgi:hypothetical protein
MEVPFTTGGRTGTWGNAWKRTRANETGWVAVVLALSIHVHHRQLSRHLKFVIREPVTFSILSCFLYT